MHLRSTRFVRSLVPILAALAGALTASAMIATSSVIAHAAPSTAMSASASSTGSASAAVATASSFASAATDVAPDFASGDSTKLAPGKLPLHPGGLTADEVAARAAKTSVAAKVDAAKLRAAAIAVDLAWDAYLPRLSVRGSYRHDSTIDPPGATALPVMVGSGSAMQPLVAPGTTSAAYVPFSLASLNPPTDQWAFGASLIVPLSDYVGRLYEQKDAARDGKEAAEWSARVTAAQTQLHARSAFYNWVRARGAIVVASAALEQSKAHLRDLKNLLTLKAATLADVYRVEGQVAGAELSLMRSQNLATVSEDSLRLLMHAADGEAFLLGEDVSTELPRLEADLPKLRADARDKRPELLALAAQLAAAEHQARIATTGMYPQVFAFADALDARTNPRWAFFDPDSFHFTWDVGVQLSWSPNDVLIASDTRRQADARTAEIQATRDEIEDALSLDVVTALTKVREEEVAVTTAGTQRRAAEEAYRERLNQFHTGLALSSAVIDAESDLTQARLTDLNARVDLRIAHLQLKKAIGAL